MINAGALCVAVMAIITDYIFGWIETRLVSKGLRT
jgi:osmoprotectant transport system permease protein